MLKNFEEITQDLSEEEKRLIPILLNGFKTKTKEKPIKAPEIIKSINLKKEELGLKKKFTEPRLRKMVNFIRTNSLMPLCATSNGYYVTTDKAELELQIISLEQRARSIQSCADGLKVLFYNPSELKIITDGL